ncbi:G5 domain-containing protein [Globicatella sp. PHS-GS-PNBC-21-1553]|uniref:G5 domain-containing protein n=1 Tax=Globicatella sp. PHS-GS-PNBC-21-1553 TaxID=2885764 RepID=UPI00298EE9AF|nr:G5 domain-containing protein [Globicatella sp. PHS-GS-PNBC-21-1553]WPC09013.1 G5 domain-containing protein [Globicatella sp. PHS-GS-PNBC-21-1553]
MERKNRYALRKTSNGLVSCIVGVFMSATMVNGLVVPVQAQTTEEETTVTSEVQVEEVSLEETSSIDETTVEEITFEETIDQTTVEDTTTEETTVEVTTIEEPNDENIKQSAIDNTKEDLEQSEIYQKTAEEDLSKPELINISIDKTEYRAGENIIATLKVKDESELTRVFVSFYNLTHPDQPTLSGGQYNNFVKNEDGTYTVRLIIDIPENTPNSDYVLNWVSITDKWNNDLDLYKYNNDLPEINIKVSTDKIEDLNKPELIDISIDKTEYKVGESIRATLKVKDESELTRVFVSFYNLTHPDQPTLSGGQYNNFVKNEDGTYTVRLIIDIPENTPNSNYVLNWVSITDKWNNDLDLYKYNNDLPEINIKVSTDKIEDLNKPELIDISIDKTEYKVGESIRATLKVKDESELTRVFVSFYNLTHPDQPTLSGGQYNNFVKNEDGTYTVRLIIDIPENTPNSNYVLNWVSITDKWNNDLDLYKYNNDLPELNITVIYKLDFQVVEKFEAIPFKTERIETSDLPEGEEKVQTAGVNGEQKITTTTPMINNKPYGEATVSKETTKAPVNQVVLVGTGKIVNDVKVTTAPIPFTTKFIENPDALKGTEKVTQKGVDGVLTTTTTTPMLNGKQYGEVTSVKETTKEAVPQIIEIGTGVVTDKVEVTTEAIPFKTERIETVDLPEGEEKVQTVGVNGEQKITTTTPMLNNKPYGEATVSKETTKAPVNKVVLVGTGKIEQVVTTSTKPIPFTTKFIENPDLLKGEEKVIQEGVDGVMTITTTTPTWKGQAYGEATTTEKVTTQPIEKIVEVGVGTIEVKEEVVTRAIDFETEVVEKPDMLKGTEEVTQAGVKGEMTVTTTTQYLNGKVYGEPVVTEKRIKEPVKEIIQKGTGVLEEKTEVIESELLFETQYELNVELDDMAKETKQAGINGKSIRTVVTQYLNGKVYGEPVVTEEITAKPVTEVIEVGEGLVEPVIEKTTEAIDYETETIENADLEVGVKNVKQAGVKGELTRTTTTYFIFGKQYGEAEVSEDITLEPVKEIIEVGTKVVEDKQSTEKTTGSESNKSEEVVKVNSATTLPNTGEIDYRQVFTPAALTILAGLGLIVTDKKRKPENE